MIYELTLDAGRFIPVKQLSQSFTLFCHVHLPDLQLLYMFLMCRHPNISSLMSSCQSEGCVISFNQCWLLDFHRIQYHMTGLYSSDPQSFQQRHLLSFPNASSTLRVVSYRMAYFHPDNMQKIHIFIFMHNNL